MFFAFYDFWGYGEGILTRHHTTRREKQYEKIN
jgi:hypothetical protein